MLNDKQRMMIEANAARLAFDAALADLSERGGDLRMFAAAMLAASVRLHVEIEGTEGLHRAVARLASVEIVGSGQAGRC
ncbi:hypothetical protein [Pontitalea aquivivens]|uniref:hypothetical protein n=1 Tax=Pontitalea aquivivens TaxID=3388663 RepID=UPI003970FA44